MMFYNYISASKNTDSSVFYTEIEAKILNTQNINTDCRDPIIRVIAILKYRGLGNHMLLSAIIPRIVRKTM